VTLFLAMKSIPDCAMTSSNSMSVFKGAEGLPEGLATGSALAIRPLAAPAEDCAGEGDGEHSKPIAMRPMNRPSGKCPQTPMIDA
jgi:hypothetical protein